MAVIKTSSLSKTYHESVVPVHALKNVNLSFESGELSAVVGPSGSGKSTLFHLIGGLDTPTQGKVIIDGTDLGTMSSGALIEFRLYNIGFVFQAYNLIPVLTAVENVEFVMLLQKKNKDKRRKRALELLDAVGLSSRINHRPVQLSGGEQQRVAVARALASRPKFVLADEPTANLDSHSADTLLDMMVELNSNYGMTFIFSTHDERVIRRARRVITLHDGEVVSDGNKK
jgi:putative ABC transport system ATP-binding protein